MTIRPIATSLLALVAAGLPLAAQAQAAPAAPASDAAVSDTAASDDIVVTAQRRRDTAQNTGIALNVISGDQLARRGVTSINDLQNQVPGLEIVPAFGSGQPQFRLRGVGFDDYASNNSPTVGVYIDDVAYPVPVMTQSALFDISRVEVLRGPQGTLYGRNTTGGAINFISNKPTDTLTGGVNLEYGSFAEFKGEGYLSGPLAPNLLFRIAAQTEQGGGFQYNRDTGQKLGDANRTFVKGALEWRASPAATITLNVHGGYDKSEETGMYLFQPFQTRGYGPVADYGRIIPADGNTRATGWGFSQAFTGLFGWDANSKPHRDNVSQGLSLNADIDLSPAIKLTSITAYDYFRRAELQSWDASNAEESEVFWFGNDRVLSQELRLSSQGKSAVDWVGGIYYSHELQSDGFYSDFTNSLGYMTLTSYEQYVDSISAYGQANWHITPRLTLVGGLRYEHESRKLRNFLTEVVGSTPLFADGDRNTGFDEVSGKAGIEYRPENGLLVYANFSRGVKSGGFTAYNSPYQDQIDAFLPEVLYAYEVGFKSDLTRAVQFNGAAFFYDYHNQQVLGTVLDQQTGYIGRITNAPHSEIYGVEGELVVTPAKGFKINQSVSWKYGKYLNYNAIDSSIPVQGTAGNYTATTIDYNGRALPIARLSYQGSASYAAAVGNYTVEAATDYDYRGRLPSILGTIYDLQARWIVNANLTVRPANGAWSIGVFGRNIFNSHYDLERNYFLPDAKVAQPGRPASYGVQLGVKF
jgi:iron complex outermembrane recepter protein